MDNLRAGMIGYGFAGSTFHAPVLTAVPGIELVKVVERSTSRSKERYPHIEVVSDVQSLYRDDSLGLIIVTTPSTDHYTFIRDALLSGKHVVVEKPFTVTSAEADELIELASSLGLMLSVYHNRRWDGDYLTIQELLKEGLLGEVVEAEFHWDYFSPHARQGNWREQALPGAGILYDLGVHFLDQAMGLFGKPEAIEADVRIQREGGQAHDYFDLTLRYKGQLKVVMKSSKQVREPYPRYVLHGTRGSFVKYGLDPQEDALKSGHTPSTPGYGIEREEAWGKLHTHIGELRVEGRVATLPGSYAAYYQNIYEHIRNGAELAVKPQQARMTIRLVELALQSAAERRMIEIDY
ncbi:oxidoreductase [Paenibacillus sp. GCM10023252]|uniref:oxidoreductase n=1 Tax=Paenibacillus sp. GCM10023252 TaxID=3252649 RepID=UPI00360F6C4B